MLVFLKNYNICILLLFILMISNTDPYFLKQARNGFLQIKCFYFVLYLCHGRLRLVYLRLATFTESVLSVSLIRYTYHTLKLFM